MTENHTNSKEMLDMLFDRKSCNYLSKHASVSRPGSFKKYYSFPTTQWEV